MMGIGVHTQRAKEIFRRWRLRLGDGAFVRVGRSLGLGFLLSAVSIRDHPAPLVLGMLCSFPPGIGAVSLALGGCVGYLFLWQDLCGLGWMASGLAAVALLADRPVTQRQKLLIPAVSGLLVSAGGTLFLLLGRPVPPIPIYLLQVATAVAAAAVCQSFHRSPATGSTAYAQVRLEQAAMSLQKMAQVLLPNTGPDPDLRGLLHRVEILACDGCPERQNCSGRGRISGLRTEILERPGLGPEDLPADCARPGRLLAELHRGQEYYRRIKQDRNLRRSYWAALEQQYEFLFGYLRSLSDHLAQIPPARQDRFAPDVGVSSQGLQGENGDLCIWFPGLQNQFYLLLCDGMGTGHGAAENSRRAAELLRLWLESGFGAEHALRSLNSLVTLRGDGGCVTVDLVEVDLVSGRGAVYKWGAAPSYLMVGGQLRKIGTAGPPPGLSQQARETTDRLSLGRGEVLILLSDGARENTLLHPEWTAPERASGELAAAILERSCAAGDDATAAVLRLNPVIQ